MVIAVGLACRDGLVLCAERQVGTPDFEYYERKVFPITLAPGRGTVVLVYARLPYTARVSTSPEKEGRRCLCPAAGV